MKLTFLVYNEYVDTRVKDVLKSLAIDYYTRWEQVKGKGHSTEAHTGQAAHATTNIALMIGIMDDSVLEKLIADITSVNQSTRLPDEHIRLFQVPMERMV